MSFGDLEKGAPRTYNVPWGDVTSSSFSSDSAQDSTTFDRASHTIFTISNNVATIQKLVSQFGTPKDTHDMRTRLHTLTENTRDMVRQTGADLKTLLGRPHQPQTLRDRQKKMAHQKLSKDFESVLKRFQSVSQVAAEKSREYVNLARAVQAHEEQHDDDQDDSESQPLMSRQREQLALLDNEIEFNEALIAEREEDLKGIEQSIAEVNEIFRDLGTLVHEQQYMLDNIESNVQSVEINMENATGELRTADRYQRASRNKLCCVMVVVAITVLVLVLVIVT
ncbi:hypothetical protein SpCBS45565_g05956 [Spizellomyces sp. 'palustris']|nr:hypothetical protein SpCBS45565_g05956 [Spizellomyces sp. 'palustris']